MLEASPAGMKAYKAVGFGKAEWPGAEIWIDLMRWENGGDKGQEFEDDRLRADPSRKDGWYAQIVMVRPAKASGDVGAMPIETGENGAVVVSRHVSWINGQIVHVKYPAIIEKSCRKKL